MKGSSITWSDNKLEFARYFHVFRELGDFSWTLYPFAIGFSFICLSMTKKCRFQYPHSKSSPNTEQMQHEAPVRATKTLAWVTAQILPPPDVDEACMLTVMHSCCELDRAQGKCVWNWESARLACTVVRFNCARMWFRSRTQPPVKVLPLICLRLELSRLCALQLRSGFTCGMDRFHWTSSYPTSFLFFISMSAVLRTVWTPDTTQWRERWGRNEWTTQKAPFMHPKVYLGVPLLGKTFYL